MVLRAPAQRVAGRRPLGAPCATHMRPLTPIALARAPARSRRAAPSSGPPSRSRRPVTAAAPAPAAAAAAAAQSLPLLERDPALAPFEDHLSYRWRRYGECKAEIEQAVAADPSSSSSSQEPPLARFADAYKTWGLQRVAPPPGDGARGGGGGGSVTLREWIPGASAVALIGDFNGWTPRDGLDWATRDAYGVWTLSLPDDGGGGGPAVPHGSRYKLRVQSASGGWWADRVSAWARYAVVPQGQMGATYDGVAWWPSPEERHAWRHPRPPPLPTPPASGGGGGGGGAPSTAALRIYEAHVGMSGEREEVASYAHFADFVLPRIKAQGYNAVQLMAVQVSGTL
jgi:1,4-alpha-glucan branching enzyme